MESRKFYMYLHNIQIKLIENIKNNIYNIIYIYLRFKNLKRT